MFRQFTTMEKENASSISRDASQVNDGNAKVGLLAGLHAFLAREITIEASPLLTSDSLPPAPIGPRQRSKIETSAEVPTESSQLELEIE